MTNDEREQRITRMVERFYELGNQDPVLGPVFAAAITDWPGHIQIVADFWSHTIYGTGRYRGNPFAVHRDLDFPIEAFDAWLRAFTQAVQEVLTPLEAETAMTRARLMTNSIRVGMFPYTAPDGTPSRHPAKG